MAAVAEVVGVVAIRQQISKTKKKYHDRQTNYRTLLRQNPVIFLVYYHLRFNVTEGPKTGLGRTVLA